MSDGARLSHDSAESPQDEWQRLVLEQRGNTPRVLFVLWFIATAGFVAAVSRDPWTEDWLFNPFWGMLMILGVWVIPPFRRLRWFFVKAEDSSMDDSKYSKFLAGLLGFPIATSVLIGIFSAIYGIAFLKADVIKSLTFGVIASFLIPFWLICILAITIGFVAVICFGIVQIYLQLSTIFKIATQNRGVAISLLVAVTVLMGALILRFV